MTISSEILSRSPILYWKLDETSGTTAADSSGHGRTGTFTGAYALGQYGPEAGTKAIQLSNTGKVTMTGLAQLGTAPFSVIFYMSMDYTNTPVNAQFVRHGFFSATRGWAYRVGSSPTLLFSALITTGAANSATNWNMPTWVQWWHVHAFTFNGSGSFSFYTDGTLSQTLGLGGTLQTITTAENFEVNAQAGIVIAHLAYYDKVLTTGDITAISGFRQPWPFGPMANSSTITGPIPEGGGALDPTDPVVIDLTADLDEIKRAVRRTYP